MRWNGTAWNVEPLQVRSTSAALWAAAGGAPGTVFGVGNAVQVRKGGTLGPARTLAIRGTNA